MLCMCLLGNIIIGAIITIFPIKSRSEMACCLVVPPWAVVLRQWIMEICMEWNWEGGVSLRA